MTMQANLLGAQIYSGLLLTFAKLFKERKTRCHGLLAQISPRVQWMFLKSWIRSCKHYWLEKKQWPDEDCHPRVQRLMKSFAQDLMFGVNRGKIKPPKQILLLYAVKTLTNNFELIQIKCLIVAATELPIPSLKKSTLHCAFRKWHQQVKSHC